MQVNRFAKCDSCQIVKDNSSSIKTQKEKHMLLEFRESHLNQQNMCYFSMKQYFIEEMQ